VQLACQCTMNHTSRNGISFMARCASPIMATPLSRWSTQSMGIDKLTHRASPWYPATALQQLGKGTTIPGALRLVAKHHGNAETDNIGWTEY
ncbi:MAG: hypothetical protein ACE1ZH_05985, partial [Gammaproteobacteria bacterium]